ncbi:MAG: tRNA preQ1(34) S-adenosylmethionine ribosyltransferase-isomerase QueA [Bryobacteraceae bacterium]
MQLSDFDYRLPDELIAQAPLADRAASRMLVVDRASGRFEDRHFRDLPRFLRPGDCLVINDTRVIPSRLYGRKEGYSREVEIFLLTPQNPERTLWTALVRPGRHLHEGARVRISERLSVEILETRVRGERLVRVHCEGDLDEEIERIGHVPLPPYIHRPDERVDRERYQTVFARQRGSAAAPTAGLHFTPEVLNACRAAGAEIAPVTLHVGLGTFQPLLSNTVEENRLHSERYSIPPETAAKLAAAKRRIAVGTTVVRTLESAVRNGGMAPQEGETDLFIYPGFEFRAVDAMLTNFHLPKSSLLLLVCAFGGKDLILSAYRHAVEHRYRFFSYGDCMLIL